jgi:hypothetical protein
MSKKRAVKEAVNMPMPRMPEPPDIGLAMMAQEAKPEPIAIRKARLVAAYAALKAVRFERYVDYDAADKTATGLAAAIARLELD